jgi:hypothetical protein
MALTPEQKRLKTLKARIDALKPKIQTGQALSPSELKDMDEFYGPIARLISSEPSLLAIFQSALRNKQALSAMGQKSFIEAVQRSSWYASTTTNQRAYQTFAKAPRNKAQMAYKTEEIRSAVEDHVVNELGLDPVEVKTKIDAVVQDLLENHFMDWQSSIQKATSRAFSDIKATELGGKVGTSETTIRAYYRSMGLPVDDKSMGEYTSKMLNGHITEETIKQGVQKNAIQMWPQFADRIKAGESVDNILYPYKQMLSSILEVDPESVDITRDGNGIDPLLQRALFSGADSKSVMSLTDLRKAAKQDKRWQYTRNAKDEYASLTKDIMSMFGAGV